MPNTVVKLSDADDSQLATARENMSLPDTKGKPARRIVARVFLLSVARVFLLSAARAFLLSAGVLRSGGARFYGFPVWRNAWGLRRLSRISCF